MVKKYDLIVIGGGGGIGLSSAAANVGYKAAVIEKEKFGGTCLNRGCIPSKMLIHPANVSTLIKESSKFDLTVSKPRVDFSRLVGRISRTIDKDAASIQPSYDSYKGEAKFISNRVLQIGKKRITAKRIFIATGARSFVPPIPGLKGTPYMTSREALRNRKLPKKLIVIGGGYIGCEMGYAYSALGSDVHFVVRGKLLARVDEDVQKEFSRVFRKNQKVQFGNTEKVEYKNKKFTVIGKDPKGKPFRVSGDALLVATGVKPYSDNLGLENTKVKTNKRGFIKVNKFMEAASGVYAIGDVIGRYMFRHVVNYEAQFLFNTLYMDKKKKAIKYPPIPYAVFTHPEIGSVGMTEEQVIEKKIPYVVGLNHYEVFRRGY